ncbi:Uncharacterized protein dnm_084220 [Desulfonema magnum]|uniref:Uncharacterized protein n=1 Tax=Desulfonema magnum TaxID=45655 RepID=A0A975BV76_9BACT|nr:Uncharacterized protein dnm_084220 [Desulfonema magnum]
MSRIYRYYREAKFVIRNERKIFISQPRLDNLFLKLYIIRFQ